MAQGVDVVGERKGSLLDGGASETTDMPCCNQAKAKEEKKEKEEEDEEEQEKEGKGLAFLFNSNFLRLFVSRYFG